MSFAENQRGGLRTSNNVTSLNNGGGKPGQGYAAIFEPRYARNGRGAPSDVSPPLKAENGKTGKGDGASMLNGNHQVRRLLPVETERLQGLTDNWTRISYRGKPESECPDGPRYRAIGNGLAVPVVKWIGERINAVEKEGF